MAGLPRRFMRRVFFRETIEGEHARVRVEEKGPLAGSVRREGKILKPEYSTGMTIASLLFPKNFSKQIASGDPLREGLPEKHITYSEPVILDDKSQAAIERFYAYHHAGRKPLESRLYKRHYLRVRDNKIHKRGAETPESIQHGMEQAGIRINYDPMNVGFDLEGNPVFFEVVEVNVSRLKEAVKKIKNKLRRKQAEGVLQELEKVIPQHSHNHFYDVHYHGRL